MARVEKFLCGHQKVAGNLRRRRDGEKGVQCKICRKAQNLRWRIAHPEWYREEQRKLRRQRIEPLMREQKGLCAICEKVLKYPYLDHKHSCCPKGTTGCENCRRGLLCPDCNQKLAALEKPGWLKKGKAYLRKWRSIK